MENPQPAFYAIIPASVRYNKNLEPNAKLLYGELTALANMHGYCWAKNEYFADLYEVDVRTVKRWIESLKDANLIKVEVAIQGFKRTRKIWITREIQKMFTKGQKCPYRGDKNVPSINNTTSTTEKISLKIDPKSDADAVANSPPAQTFFSSGRVKMLQEEYEALVQKNGHEKVDDMIEQLGEYADIDEKKFMKYKNHATVIKSWIRRSLTSPSHVAQNRLDELKAWCQSSEIKEGLKTAKNRSEVDIGPDYIHFLKIQYGYISLTGPAAKEKIKNNLRKMGLLSSSTIASRK